MTFQVPPPPQGLGPTRLFEIFDPVAKLVASIRNTRGLPPLQNASGQPSGNILVGRKLADQPGAPPRIVVVPTGTRYETARPMGSNPKPFALRWLQFDAHFLGNSDPNEDPLHDYDAALELEREFFYALKNTAGNTPNLKWTNGDWAPSGTVHNGQLLIVPFEVGTPMTEEPYIVVPYATTENPNGLSISATVEAIFDGTEVPVGTIVIPTP